MVKLWKYHRVIAVKHQDRRVIEICENWWHGNTNLTTSRKIVSLDIKLLIYVLVGTYCLRGISES